MTRATRLSQPTQSPAHRGMAKLQDPRGRQPRALEPALSHVCPGHCGRQLHWQPQSPPRRADDQQSPDARRAPELTEVPERKTSVARAKTRFVVATTTHNYGVFRLRLARQAEPAAATSYGFGHFAGGFVDHFAFIADGAAAFAFGRLAIGGQDAFGAGVGGRVGRIDPVDRRSGWDE